MFKMKTLTAGLTALSLSFATMTAAPAQAGDDDAAKFIAGALTLFIIGQALSDNNRGTVRVQTGSNHGSNHGGYGNNNHNANYGDRRELPRECAFSIETRRDGLRKVYGSQCLEDNMRRANRLPQRCEDTITIRRPGGRTVSQEIFYEDCLRNAGYRPEQR